MSIITGTSGDDLLTGASDSDYIYGLEGNDSLYGAAGNDRLYGGTGIDHLYGGDGRDSFYIDVENPGQDYYYGGDGPDVIRLWGEQYSNLLLDSAHVKSIESTSVGGLISGTAGNNSFDISGISSATDSTYSLGDGDDRFIGYGGRDDVDGGAGNDTLIGLGAHDTLKGGAGNDSLDGGDSSDDLYGGAGNDIIHGGGGNDELYSGAGIDHVYAGAGDDTFFGDAGNDYLYGGQGNDTFSIHTGDLGQDYYYGGKGTDYIWIRADIQVSNLLMDSAHVKSIEYMITGSGSISGTAGNDSFDLSGFAFVLGNDAASRNFILGDGDDSFVGHNAYNYADGGAGNDNLSGQARGDKFQGGDGADTLNGGGGADQLVGGAGQDSLLGGTGVDTLIGGTGADILDGKAGHDVLSYAGATSGVKIGLWNNSASGGDATGDIIRNFENVAGGEGNDNLSGDSAGNLLQGEGGADTVTGGAGADTLDGGAGTDTLSYGNAATAVTIGLWNNSASGGDANGDLIVNFENVIGSARNDILSGDSANNMLLGRGGADILFGGVGADTLDGGGGGNDTLSYGNTATSVKIGLWDHSASGGDADGDVIRNIENVIGGAGHDRLSGDNANNLLDGGRGADTLNGGAGADRLDGGSGRDIMKGGAEDGVRDAFIFRAAGESVGGANRDVIFDFSSGIDDINLAQIDANISANGNQAFVWSGATARAHGVWTVEAGDHKLVRADVNGDRAFDFEIAVRDISRLTADDFVF